MPQKFSNNATTALAEALTDSATTMVVDSDTGFATLASGDSEMVTIETSGAREIVLVTAKTGTSWTITREQEGTTARAWDAGATVEARLTAGVLSGMSAQIPLMAYNAPGGNAIGDAAISIQPERSASSQVASGENSIAIGGRSIASADNAVAVGWDCGVSGWGSVAIGGWSVGSGSHAVAMGAYADAAGGSAVSIGYDSTSGGAAAVSLGYDSVSDGASSVAIGAEAEAESADSVCVGPITWASATSSGATCVGVDAYANNAPSGVAVGDYAYSNAQSAIAIGHDSTAAGVSAIAIGRNAVAQTAHTAHVAAIQRHVKPSALVAPLVTDRAWRTATLSAPVVTLMSESLNLASTASTIDLVIPPNTRFFVDSVGLIVDAATSPAGTPQISITDLLSAENVTAATLWSRQIWKDQDSAGLAGTLSITVPTALTSGTLTARVYLTGLIVQV